jgi:hypothetical protein
MAIAVPLAALKVEAADTLTDAQLRGMIAGKRIYLSAPGGEFPMNYRPNGVVDATGEAIGLGRFAQPTDSGRWWIRDNRICQQWTSWYDGKVFCFAVKATGPGRITWQRDDGASGTARIAE